MRCEKRVHLRYITLSLLLFSFVSLVVLVFDSTVCALLDLNSVLLFLVLFVYVVVLCGLL